MSPGGQENPTIKGMDQRLTEWQEAVSDGLAEGWIVKGLVVNEGPQNMQELVHKNTQGLHFGERVIGSPLQMGIE